jgi:hypothetical protein
MNLLYECKECKQTWTELKKECSDCGCEDYTVIQDDGAPASPFWKWAGILAMSAVAVGVVWSLYPPEDPPNTGDWKFEIEEEYDNYFRFKSNDDSLFFKSLVNGQELTVIGNKVYPCMSGEYMVVNSQNIEKTLHFTIQGTPHPDACNCDCSDLLSFSFNSDCDYTAESAKSSCNSFLMISFDGDKWEDEGDLKFSKSEVGEISKLYYKFSCMPVENLKVFTFATCTILPPKPAPSLESLNISLDEEYNKQSSAFREAYTDCIFNTGSNNRVFHYKNSLGDSGPHEFMDLIMFDLNDLRNKNSAFAISSVKYNGDSTRILKVEFNNLN